MAKACRMSHIECVRVLLVVIDINNPVESVRLEGLEFPFYIYSIFIFIFQFLFFFIYFL